MTDRHSVLPVLSVVMAGLAVACGGKAPPPVTPPPVTVTIAAPPEAKIKATMALAVSADANPDASGRPSPVVIHVYQLRADGPFRAADFVALTDDDGKSIDEVRISHNEYLLRPGENQNVDVTIANDATFVGVAAGFRDFRNAQWRAVVAAPRKGLTIAVERARVVVTPTP